GSTTGSRAGQHEKRGRRRSRRIADARVFIRGRGSGQKRAPPAAWRRLRDAHVGLDAVAELHEIALSGGAVEVLHAELGTADPDDAEAGAARSEEHTSE